MRCSLTLLLLLSPASGWADTTPAVTPIPDVSKFGSPCPYPQSALEAHSEGITFISYRGTDDGRVADVKVLQSSGHIDLDVATVQCASHWRFDPASYGTREVGVRRTTITWSLAPTGGSPPAGTLTGIPHSCLSYYPAEEKKAGIQGTTRLQMTITEDGDVRDLVVATSSGNANLDKVALQCASHWRYKPAIQNGKPVAVTWKADVVWKLEVPQLPSFAEPPRDCVHAYSVKSEDLVRGDGTTEVTFVISKGEVVDARITHSSGNSNLDHEAIDCIESRKYIRQTVWTGDKSVDKYRSMTIREQINWADALRPRASPTTSPN